MKSNPLISIIIPTLNRAHFIVETLNSVQAQSYTNWECIVVDDGSTDQTANVLKSYLDTDSRFQYHLRPLNRLAGGNAARNYGFELSKGEYIQWFDDDDIMMPEMLQERLKAFDENINLVITNGFKVTNSLEKKSVFKLHNKYSLYKSYALRTIKMVTQSVILKKSFLINKPLFNEGLVRGQETDLFLRLFWDLHKTEYKVLDVPMFLYRQHDSTKTFLDQHYNPKFKESKIKVFIDVYAKAIKIEDKDLISYYYRLLIKAFFKAIEKKHNTIYRLILNALVIHTKKRNSLLAGKVFFLGMFSMLINKRSSKIEGYLLSQMKLLLK